MSINILRIAACSYIYKISYVQGYVTYAKQFVYDQCTVTNSEGCKFHIHKQSKVR